MPDDLDVDGLPCLEDEDGDAAIRDDLVAEIVIGSRPSAPRGRAWGAVNSTRRAIACPARARSCALLGGSACPCGVASRSR
jgi:hypothetical protein